jgi:DNA-binding phage protein
LYDIDENIEEILKSKNIKPYKGRGNRLKRILLEPWKTNERPIFSSQRDIARAIVNYSDSHYFDKEKEGVVVTLLNQLFNDRRTSPVGLLADVVTISRQELYRQLSDKGNDTESCTLLLREFNDMLLKTLTERDFDYPPLTFVNSFKWLLRQQSMANEIVMVNINPEVIFFNPNKSEINHDLESFKIQLIQGLMTNQTRYVFVFDYEDKLSIQNFSAGLQNLFDDKEVIHRIYLSNDNHINNKIQKYNTNNTNDKNGYYISHSSNHELLHNNKIRPPKNVTEVISRLQENKRLLVLGTDTKASILPVIAFNPHTSEGGVFIWDISVNNILQMSQDITKRWKESFYVNIRNISVSNHYKLEELNMGWNSEPLRYEKPLGEVTQSDFSAAFNQSIFDLERELNPKFQDEEDDYADSVDLLAIFERDAEMKSKIKPILRRLLAEGKKLEEINMNQVLALIKEDNKNKK